MAKSKTTLHPSIISTLLFLFFNTCPIVSLGQTFWTEDFGTDPGACFNKGSLVATYAGVNGPWTMTDNSPTMICVTSGSAPTPNTFYISATEAGMGSSICGDGCLNNIALTNQTLHVGNIATSPSAIIFCPPGDCGAAYDSGGLCVFGLGGSTETDIRAESPTINCSGQSGITLCFTYMENGDGTLDNATVWYFDGSTWAQLDDPMKTATSCPGAGFWRDHSIALPASADGNPNVKIGFSWVNNDDGSGSDPSFAVDDIILSTLPALPVMGPINVCENDVGVAYTIPFNPGSTYTWAISGGGGSIASGQGTENIMIDWGGSGTYTVSVSETSNCGTVVHIDLVVTVSVCGGSPPIANFTVSDTAICEGDCIDFFDASTNSPTNWTWNFPGSISGSALGPGPHNICYDSTGTYDVDLIATNSSGSDNNVKTNHITVFPTVNFDAEYDTSMCEGDSVDLHINNLIGGLEIDSIHMYFISQFTHTTPSTVAGGIYYLTVEGFYWGSTGEKRDAAYKYENNNQPITPIPSSMWKIDGNGPGKPCPTDYNPNHLYYFYFTGTGSGVTFTFDDTDYSDNGGKLIFRMYYVDSNPNSILWSNGDTEPCINVAPSVTTTYTATVTNAGGCSGTESATVTIIPSSSVNAGTDTLLCGPTAFPLSGSSSNAGGESYLWMTQGDGIFSNDTILNPIYNPGIADSNNGSVNLVLMGMDSAGICAPSFDTILLILAKFHSLDSINTIDASGCGLSDGSATAFASGGVPPYTYLWSDGQTTSTAMNLADGNYSVTITGSMGCSVASNPITISTPGSIPSPITGTSSTYCDGDALNDLTATTGSGGTVTWYSDSLLTTVIGTGSTLTPTNAIGTTYYYATETAGGCESPADTVAITINPLPSAPSVNADATYCQGDAMTDLTATAGSGGSITWYSDTALSVIIGTGSSLSPSSTLGTTVYYATETAGGCESGADSAVIIITAQPAMPTVTTSATYCEGETMTDLTATNSGGGTITWYSNAGLSNILGTGSTFAPLDSLGTTIYYATETVGGCESGSDTVTVTIYLQAPIPAMGANITLCPFDTVQGIVATPSWNGTITWYSDAGLTTIIDTGETLLPNLSQGDNIFYATETALCCCPSEPGMITVTLDDCDTIPDNVYMPNVFYVSGSNPDNNRLHVFGNGIAELNLIIYDRWGEKVYETSDVSFTTRNDGLCCTYGTGWDGTYMNAGKALNTAVFAYILSGKLESGEEFFEKGNITLIK